MISSLDELKERIMHALCKRSDDFKTLGFNITEEDIFVYLKNNKWMHSKDLSLNEIVNDILKLDVNVMR